MQHESYIIPYLQKHRKLPLAGIGLVLAEKVSARLNYGTGVLTPPAFELRFIEQANQALNTDNLSEEDAKILEVLSNEILEKLKSEKVITLCNLIRFYMDVNGKIQFRALDVLPAPAMYGLPDLSYFPVSRTAVEKTSIQHTEKVPVATVVSAKKAKRKHTGKPIIFGWKTLVSAAAVLIFVLATFTAINYLSDRSYFQSIPVSEHIKERLNKKPGEVPKAEVYTDIEPEVTESTTIESSEEELAVEAFSSPSAVEDSLLAAEVEVEVEDIIEEEPNLEEVVSEEFIEEPIIEKPASAPQSGSIIFIELLCNENNVARLVKSIEADTYASFTRPRGRCTQVGIYSNSVHENLNTALSIIRQKYNEQAFVE